MSGLAQPIRRLVDVRQFRSYVLAGALSLGCEYCLFLLLYYAVGLSVVVSNVLAFGIGLLLNFTLNRQWAFKTSSRDRSHRQFAMYALAAAFNVTVTTELLLATKHIGIEPWLTKPVIVAIFAVWNYVLLRRFVFAG